MSITCECRHPDHDHYRNGCAGWSETMCGPCVCKRGPDYFAMARIAADRLEQIRKLQDSANKRLDEYREVTAFLREVLNRLEVEAYEGRPYPRDSACGGCPTCDILKRAEVMNLR